MYANDEDPDQRLCSLVSNLSLHGLPMPHERNARLIIMILYGLVTKIKYAHPVGGLPFVRSKGEVLRIISTSILSLYLSLMSLQNDFMFLTYLINYEQYFVLNTTHTISKFWFMKTLNKLAHNFNIKDIFLFFATC